jgi:hypothetical protein
MLCDGASSGSLLYYSRFGFGYPSVSKATAFPAWAAAATRSAAHCTPWTIAAAAWAATSAAGAVLGTAKAAGPAHSGEGRP